MVSPISIVPHILATAVLHLELSSYCILDDTPASKHASCSAQAQSGTVSILGLEQILGHMTSIFWKNGCDYFCYTVRVRTKYRSCSSTLLYRYIALTQTVHKLPLLCVNAQGEHKKRCSL